MQAHKQIIQTSTQIRICSY